MLPVFFIAIAAVGLIGVLVMALTRQTAAADGPTHHSTTLVANEPSKKKTDQLRERLVHAGLYKKNSPSFFYLTQLAFASIPIGFGFLSYSFGMIDLNMALMLGLLFGISGVIAPGLWLDFRKSRRQRDVRRSIPDALDVITICVEAGLSLGASIVRVSKDLQTTYPLLATELTIVHRHMQMGKSTGEALRSFAERFDLSELRSLASVVMQSEKFGASIASALRVHAETLRKKRMQKAHEKAQKAAVWILIPTVLCIFPALFVVILGPAAYDIFDMLKNLEGRSLSIK